MNTDNHTPDTASVEFSEGMTAGYNALGIPEGASVAFVEGYASGEFQWNEDCRYEAEADAEQDARESAYYAYEAEQDFYDYEPSPYDGTYSEM
jgi:hypothetical protein